MGRNSESNGYRKSMEILRLSVSDSIKILSLEKQLHYASLVSAGERQRIHSYFVLALWSMSGENANCMPLSRHKFRTFRAGLGFLKVSVSI